MKLRPRSLDARLALAPLLVLGFARSGLLVCAWWHGGVAADQAYDRVLVGGALQIAENTWMNKGVLDVDLPLAAFSVRSARDRVPSAARPGAPVVAGDPALQADIPWDAVKRGPVLRSAVVRGQPVRVAIAGRHVVAGDPNGWTVIVLAQTRLARRARAPPCATASASA